MQKHENDVEGKIKKSLRYSILDGSFFAAMVGFGDSFFSAFAVFLKATNIELSLLSSLPQAIGSSVQLLSNKLIKLLKSRQKLAYLGATLQAMMYILVALTFFMGKMKVTYLVLFLSLYYTFGFVIIPAWSSWMGDLVDANRRGDYFGRRNKITGLVTFATFLTGGYILQNFTDGTTKEFIGFATLFLLAMIARLISAWYLKKKYEPKYEVLEESQFTLMQFLKRAPSANFGKFVFYLCLMNLVVYIAAPFFTPYMLKDLNMSYMAFTAVNATAILAKYMTMPIWGRLSDKYGTKKILGLAGIIMPIVPLLWLLSGNFWYILAIQAYTGLAWAAFEMASFNFILDVTTPQKRATCVAYYNLLNGWSILAGAVIGGLIIRYNPFTLHSYLLVFLISGVLRYVASIIFLPKIKEMRTVESISYNHLLVKFVSALGFNERTPIVISFKNKIKETKEAFKSKLR